MAGTVKLCVPELVFVEELVVRGELFGCTEAVAVTEGARVGESACVGDDAGVPVSADVGDAPGVEAKAVADPFVAADAAAEGFDPLAPHALRPAPQMTAAMITAGTRHILMLLPSGK
jgi:hypothetical protein